MRNGWLLLGFCLAINPLHAEIFKWTDSNGDVHFSDKPHPGAVEIELPKVQTYSAPKVPVAEKSPEPITKAPVEAYEKISIVQPENQLTIRNTEGYVSIIVELEPALQKGDKIQLIFDGAPLGKPQPTTVIALRDINRGSHTIAAQVVSPKGKVLNTSSTITIFMMPPRTNM